MKYSTNNMTVSVAEELATHLRSKGYDIYWWATGETQAQTLGLPTPKAIITITPSIPANPALIVRLKDGSVSQEEVAIPAFSVLVEDAPKKVARAGLGESIFLRQRNILIQGLAADSWQHEELADLLSEWIDGTDKDFDIKDYDTNATAPPSLEKAWVDRAVVLRPEVHTDIEVYRYQIHVSAGLRYYE